MQRAKNPIWRVSVTDSHWAKAICASTVHFVNVLAVCKLLIHSSVGVHDVHVFCVTCCIITC